MRAIFLVLVANLGNVARSGDAFCRKIASDMNAKLEDYWEELKLKFHISAILDPNTKLSTFPTSEEKHNARTLVTNAYLLLAGLAETQTATAETSPSTSGRRFFYKQLKQSHTPIARSDGILEAYLNSPEEIGDALAFWRNRACDSRWQPLASLARDYLAVQATSVASERIFSIAKHTITATRNRLDSEKARASLCLKSWIDSEIVEL